MKVTDSNESMRCNAIGVWDWVNPIKIAVGMKLKRVQYNTCNTALNVVTTYKRSKEGALQSQSDMI